MRFFLWLTLLLTTLLNASWALAVNISVNFTATIKETTCAMTVSALNGANLSGDSASENYFLDLPSMGVSDITNKTSKTEASFKLLPINCNNYISSMSMTIGGKHSGYTDTLLVNDSSLTGGASYIGVGFKRLNDDDSLRFKVDGTTSINWTRNDIANGFDITGIVRRTTSSYNMIPGLVQTKAIFVFTYN
ncbi:TPA: fimbrial protein [Escherichia coli]|nr:fimbrial protein [Escherichia coli]